MSKWIGQVERKSVKDLIPYEKNPKLHSDKQIQQLANSIKEWGWTIPILIDENNTVLAGHGRLFAAQLLELEQVPTMLAEGWSEKQKKAYIIADNKLSISDWDEELLRIELNDLENMDYDLDLLGFELDELNDLFPELETEGLTDEDAVPEVPVIPVTKKNDIWILGNHILMCGDSTLSDDVEILMDGEKSDMVFTDPPYNVDYGNIKHPKFKQRSIENDNMSQSDFRDFCRKFVNNIKLFCEGCVYVFSAPNEDGRIMYTELDTAMHCSTTIIWNKDVFTLGRGKYQNKYEPCWFGWHKSGASFIDDRTLTNVWDFPRPRASKLHPTMKPVELVENAIGHASNVGGKVLDLFGGSGTTLIASEKTGRHCRMMEFDPKYCDVIIQRWEEFTGNQATHKQSGKNFRKIKT